MSRARLFVLVDAFENDMRTIVEDYLLDHVEEQEALGPDFAAADELREKDAGEEPVSIVHYLHLRACYDIINRNRAKFPEELSTEVKANTPNLDALVPIRNRVMHGRPLRSEDPESTISALSGFTTRYWVQTKSTLKRLAEDPAWEPAFETLVPPAEKVLHNLPPADYDETGLIGRSDDVNRLVEMLKRRREAIVTVTGEGGIGKTALALDVAYRLVDDEATPYECVLWVSLKREILTAYGVREIADAMKDLTSATGELGRVLDNSFDGTVRELSEMLQGITTLVVVDNLETAQGSEVINLYDSLPSSVSYLFTSRLGIGEVERRYPLGGLGERHAMQLFRKFSARRGQRQLGALANEILRTVVCDNLRNSPLAIKWYILSVEAGSEPASTLANQEELLNFCVKNVYEALSTEARSILPILNSLGRSVSFNELAVLTDYSIDALRRAIQEMSRGSLVVHESDPSGGVSAKISVSPTAHMFLPSQSEVDFSTTEILRREQDYLRARERGRADEGQRSLAPNVVRSRSKEDDPAAHLLRVALSHSKKGDTQVAKTFVERARALSPDFWECDRVEAFIASQERQRERAANLYRTALSKADSDESRAVVSHFFAGHLARAMQEPELALPYAQDAHALFNNADTALALGNLLVWNGRFSEGQEMLEVALDDASGKTELIALTGVVESWKRWAEDLLEGRQPLEAFEKAAAGFKVGSDSIASGLFDLKLAASTVEAAYVALRAFSSPGVKIRTLDSRFSKMLQTLARELGLYANCRTWPRFRSSLERWSGRVKMSDENQALVAYLVANGPSRSSRSSGDGEKHPSIEGLEVGEVISWAGRYGFIKNPDYPKNVFFHRGALEGSAQLMDKVLHGVTVYFSATLDERGRDKATVVRIAPGQKLQDK